MKSNCKMRIASFLLAAVFAAAAGFLSCKAKVQFMEMVWVPGGSFELGMEIGPDGMGSVNPVSPITLTGFHIGKSLVTQEQFQTVMGTNPSWFTTANGRPPADGENDARRPVESVNWYDAIVFCNRLSIIEGLTPAYEIQDVNNNDVWTTNPDNWGSIPSNQNEIWDAVRIVEGSTGYRLPTEAQWEFAAKGGNNPPEGFIFSGSNNADDVAWHWENSQTEHRYEQGTREVKLLDPNKLGIYDMSGNVWEWCWDWWGYFSYIPKTDPTGAAYSSYRVVRGGAWNDSSARTRSVYRYNNVPSGRFYNYGFRVTRP